MRKWAVIIAILIPLSAFAAQIARSEPLRARRPNILFILIDDHEADSGRRVIHATRIFRVSQQPRQWSLTLIPLASASAERIGPPLMSMIFAARR